MNFSSKANCTDCSSRAPSVASMPKTSQEDGDEGEDEDEDEDEDDDGDDGGDEGVLFVGHVPLVVFADGCGLGPGDGDKDSPRRNADPPTTAMPIEAIAMPAQARQERLAPSTTRVETAQNTRMAQLIMETMLAGTSMNPTLSSTDTVRSDIARGSRTTWVLRQLLVSPGNFAAALLLDVKAAAGPGGSKRVSTVGRRRCRCCHRRRRWRQRTRHAHAGSEVAMASATTTDMKKGAWKVSSRDPTRTL